MKHIYKLFALFAVVVFLSSCETHELQREMDAVFACNNVDQTQDNVRGAMESEMGVIREVDFWLPGSGDGTKTDGEPEKVTLWVIYPEAFPDMILHPCRLPDAQLIPNREVSFSGILLNNYDDGFELGGVTPFMLTEISGGEEGPDDDGC